MPFKCPICTYPNLSESPRSEFGGGSFEMCPSCGFQFGVDDDDEGWTYDKWREKWEDTGRPWASRGIKKPANWPPVIKAGPVAKKAAAPAPAPTPTPVAAAPVVKQAEKAVKPAEKATAPKKAAPAPTKKTAAKSTAKPAAKAAAKTKPKGK